MKMSQREMMLAMVTGTIILFGMTSILAKPRIDEWKDIGKKKADLALLIKKNNDTIASRDVWKNQLDDLRKALPDYPADKKMDVQWMSIMDQLASKHGVKILKRQAGEEKPAGDVYELPIECSSWEANLSAIVHFLFDLQNQGAMLDIRLLQIKPKAGGLMTGKFSLYCAYAKQGKVAGEKKTSK